MATKEQIEKNKEKIRLKLEERKKRQETEAKKKAEEIRLKKEKEEGIKEREDLAVKIAKEVKLEGVRTIKGKDGKDGDSIKGEKGDKGDTIKGDKGDKGDSIKGEKGDRGDRGDSIKGNKGENGKDADEEKIVKEVLKKIPEQETHFEEIEELQNRLKELKKDIEKTPRGRYGLRGIVSLRAGTGMTIDETKVGKPILNVTANAGTVENLSGQCDGSTTVITTASNTGIIWLSLNGTMLIEGKEFTRDSATQITLTFAPETGEELYLKYV